MRAYSHNGCHILSVYIFRILKSFIYSMLKTNIASRSFFKFFFKAFYIVIPFLNIFLIFFYMNDYIKRFCIIYKLVSSSFVFFNRINIRIIKIKYRFIIFVFKQSFWIAHTNRATCMNN